MQHAPVSSFILITKRENAAAEEASRQALAWLTERGVTVTVLSHAELLAGAPVPDAGMALVFGGDGTIVSVLRRFLGRGIPVAGVNFGKVGFLAELSPATWQAGLEEAMAGTTATEQRMSLHYEILRGNCTALKGEVVNDVVLTRGKLARLVPLSLEVDGSHMVNLRSDGLVVSTPTGSTGYSSSAGGPLLATGLNAYIATAICPFLCGFPPLVLSAHNALRITVQATGVEVFLTLDGQEVHELQPGDALCVRGMPGRMHLAHFGYSGYFERLASAGFVRG